MIIEESGGDGIKKGSKADVLKRLKDIGQDAVFDFLADLIVENAEIAARFEAMITSDKAAKGTSNAKVKAKVRKYFNQIDEAIHDSESVFHSVDKLLQKEITQLVDDGYPLEAFNLSTYIYGRLCTAEIESLYFICEAWDEDLGDAMEETGSLCLQLWKKILALKDPEATEYVLDWCQEHIEDDTYDTTNYPAELLETAARATAPRL